MNSIKAAAILSLFAASQALALPAQQSSAYQCNPAHSYPGGVTCDPTALTLIARATAAPSGCVAKFNTCRQPTNGESANQAVCAAQKATCQSSCYTTFRSCQSDLSNSRASCAADYSNCLGEDAYGPDGSLTIIPDSATTSAAAQKSPYACNPAHAYPEGVQCVSTNGGLSLVTPAPTAN